MWLKGLNALRRAAPHDLELYGVGIRFPNAQDWPGEGPYGYRRAAMTTANCIQLIRSAEEPLGSRG